MRIIKTKKIWFNGKFINWNDAKIHVLTHTLHYGGGIFEGIRAYQTQKGTAVFRLKEHIDRLFYSAKILEMKIPFSSKEIQKAILELIKINKIEECYIRPIAFFGYGIMGLSPKDAPINLAIALWPWQNYLGDKPIKVGISKYIRIHPKSTMVEAKICGHYVNSILAGLEAKKQNVQEVLLFDYQGNVAEASGANIFIVKNKKLFTPSVGSIFPGITRDSILQIANNLGIETKEKNFSLKDVKLADEAFFVGTATEVCPIGEIDGVMINNRKIGEITQKLKTSYQNIIHGKEKKYFKWLTLVK